MKKFSVKQRKLFLKTAISPKKRRLQQLELAFLKRRRPRGQLIEICKYHNGFDDVYPEGLFEGDDNMRTVKNGLTLIIRNLKISQALNFIPVKIVETLNQPPKNIISAGTVNTFKNKYTTNINKYWIINSQYCNALILYS
ncbi:hypothetical protein FHG87_013182 [Trinorchestia longiramus]|nr:hypothetical protein FHG87_013182 [Trinorchestia longiramus]